MVCSNKSHNVMLITQHPKNNLLQSQQIQELTNRTTSRGVQYIFSIATGVEYMSCLNPLVWNHARSCVQGRVFASIPKTSHRIKECECTSQRSVHPLATRIRNWSISRWLGYLHVGRPRSSYPIMHRSPVATSGLWGIVPFGGLKPSIMP